MSLSCRSQAPFGLVHGEAGIAEGCGEPVESVVSTAEEEQRAALLLVGSHDAPEDDNVVAFLDDRVPLTQEAGDGPGDDGQAVDEHEGGIVVGRLRPRKPA